MGWVWFIAAASKMQLPSLGRFGNARKEEETEICVIMSEEVAGKVTWERSSLAGAWHSPSCQNCLHSTQ